MSALSFAIVDRPPGPDRKPTGAFRLLMETLAGLPEGKAIAVPAREAGMEKSFRASVCIAASKARIPVSIRKGDGVYLVMRRVDLVA